MRTAAQIGKISLCVCGYGPVFQLADKFYLVVFIAVGENFDSIGFRYAFSPYLFFSRNKFHHFLFDGGKIGFFNGDAFARVHIVVKPVLNSRADTKFYTRIKLLQGLCH
ncbi:hypothetical protein SDC9_79592 [bioreactor metagenome]|uniref:Uncharacterized protein n=1 Tax=bioreactor metagenome TaxID=1076179 RepID=A0A644YWP6_9ZZZZ